MAMIWESLLVCEKDYMQDTICQFGKQKNTTDRTQVSDGVLKKRFNGVF